MAALPHGSCVQLLLTRKADVAQVDGAAYSPLLAACEWGRRLTLALTLTLTLTLALTLAPALTLTLALSQAHARALEKWTKLKLDTAELFFQLFSFKEAGFAIGASNFAKDAATEAQMRAMGLNVPHAYCVLALTEVRGGGRGRVWVREG